MMYEEKSIDNQTSIGLLEAEKDYSNDEAAVRQRPYLSKTLSFVNIASYIGNAMFILLGVSVLMRPVRDPSLMVYCE